MVVIEERLAEFATQQRFGEVQDTRARDTRKPTSQTTSQIQLGARLNQQLKGVGTIDATPAQIDDAIRRAEARRAEITAKSRAVGGSRNLTPSERSEFSALGGNIDRLRTLKRTKSRAASTGLTEEQVRLEQNKAQARQRSIDSRRRTQTASVSTPLARGMIDSQLPGRASVGLSTSPLSGRSVVVREVGQTPFEAIRSQGPTLGQEIRLDSGRTVITGGAASIGTLPSGVVVGVRSDREPIGITERNIEFLQSQPAVSRTPTVGQQFTEDRRIIGRAFRTGQEQDEVKAGQNILTSPIRYGGLLLEQRSQRLRQTQTPIRFGYQQQVASGLGDLGARARQDPIGLTGEVVISGAAGGVLGRGANVGVNVLGRNLGTRAGVAAERIIKIGGGTSLVGAAAFAPRETAASAPQILAFGGGFSRTFIGARPEIVSVGRIQPGETITNIDSRGALGIRTITPARQNIVTQRFGVRETQTVETAIIGTGSRVGESPVFTTRLQAETFAARGRFADPISRSREFSGVVDVNRGTVSLGRKGETFLSRTSSITRDQQGLQNVALERSISLERGTVVTASESVVNVDAFASPQTRFDLVRVGQLPPGINVQRAPISRTGEGNFFSISEGTGFRNVRPTSRFVRRVAGRATQSERIADPIPTDITADFFSGPRPRQFLDRRGQVQLTRTRSQRPETIFESPRRTGVLEPSRTRPLGFQGLSNQRFASPPRSIVAFGFFTGSSTRRINDSQRLQRTDISLGSARSNAISIGRITGRTQIPGLTTFTSTGFRSTNQRSQTTGTTFNFGGGSGTPAPGPRNIDPLTPGLTAPIGLGGFGFGSFGSPGAGGGGRGFEYRPDITSTFFNIQGASLGGALTGLEIRPTKRKKRRKK